MTEPVQSLRSPRMVTPAEAVRKYTGTLMLVDSAMSGGEISIFEHDVEPGYLATPHSHQHEDQIAYILSGHIGFRIGDTEFIAGPGSTVYRPRGIPHVDWNQTTAMARMLEITVPGRVEQYFVHKRAILHEGSGSLDEVEALRAEFGIALHLDWIPEMEQRLGIKWPEDEIF